MQTIVLYAPQFGNRLRYVAHWIFVQRWGVRYAVVDHLEDAPPGAVVYGAQKDGCFCIPDSGLLAEAGCRPHVPDAVEWGGVPLLYPGGGMAYHLPGDLFAAVFYLLSRYEEHLPFSPDKHGRYPPEQSILYKMGVLQRPLVDEWLELLRQQLAEVCGITIPAPQYSFLPTYDIDIAFHTLHKGAMRTLGALAQAALNVRMGEVGMRLKVLSGTLEDPFDSFGFMEGLHSGAGTRPLFFMLSALHTGPFDKNIHPQHPAMAAVTQRIARYADVGLHPSYNHAHGEVLQQEKQVLQGVLGIHLGQSRQHYIRFQVRDTPPILLAAGIRDDYSMGYGSKLGFRAGTGSPFMWYDFSREAEGALKLHPFCFMDTTAHYEEGMTVAQAFQCLADMNAHLRRTGSKMVTIFHNFSLGTAPEWDGWARAYAGFLNGMQ